jgi:hypothetical protein
MSDPKPEAPTSKGTLAKGTGLLLAGYLLVVAHTWFTTKGIAVQPAIRAGIVLGLGIFAFKKHRLATWLLLLLCIPWFVESLVAGARPNMDWVERLIPAGRAILTAAGGFFLWKALQAQKKEWLHQMFNSQELHKASMVFDPDHDEPFLERISHLFDVGFGKLQVKEILDACKYLGKDQDARTSHFAPYYFRQQVPLQVVVSKDSSNSMDISFFTTRELAGRIEERKETYMETLGVK